MRQTAYAIAAATSAVLMLLATLTLAIVVGAAQAAPATPPGVLSPPQAQAMAQQGSLTIVDIRRPGEWQTTGVPEGASRATIRFGRGDAAFLARMRALTGGDRDMPVALICAGGVRSAYASKLLRKHGYSQVFDVAEGMLGSRAGPGWLRRDLPVEACGDC